MIENNYIPNEIIATSTDIDLRNTFHKMLYGDAYAGIKPIGRFAVLQKIIYNSDGIPKKSPYAYKVTGEVDIKNRPPNTTRTGLLCEEKLVRVHYQMFGKFMLNEFFMQMETNALKRELCFMSFYDKPKEHDYLIIIKTDENGNPINPVTAETEYEIVKVLPRESDFGRTEYYLCVIETVK